MTPHPSPSVRRRRARPAAVGLVLLAGLLIPLACSGASPDRSSSSATKSGSDEIAPGASASGGAAFDAAGASGTVPAQVAPPGEPLGAGRSIISTATLRVRVDDRARAADRVRTIVDAAKGVVFSSEADLVGHADTTLTLKVPPARFEPVLASLAKLGTPLERRTSSEDVTEQVVDLEGRLKTAQASAVRLRGLLADASDVQGIVAIESELSTREAEVESLEGRLRVISAQVDLATIEVHLTERGVPEVSDDIPGFMQGLRHGWIAFRNTLSGIVTVLGFVLPFLGVLLPFALVLRWWLRRRLRAQRPPASVPVAPT